MIAWRRRLAEVAVVAVTTVVSIGIDQWMPFLAMVENWLSDYRIATLSPAQPQSPDVVIVTITEDTLRQFPYRSPLDRHFVAQLLTRIDNAGARAIGVDLLFDQPTEPAKDDELKAVIRRIKAPLVIGFIGESEGLNEDELDYLTDFVPEESRGYVTLVKDGFDSTVRQIYPGRVDPEGHFIRGFPLAIADKVAPDRHFAAQQIVWRAPPGNGSPAFRSFPAHTVQLLPAQLLRGKIVLVGADLTLTDRHRTPFASARDGVRLMPGIEIHAHAVDQLLNGRDPIGLTLPGKILFAAAVATLGACLAQLGLRLSVNLSLALAMIAVIWISGMILFKERAISIPLILPTMSLGAAWWASGIQASWRERRQKQFLKDAFSRYMSADLVNDLLADPGKLVLGGERREMSFLFTDVAGFTTLSETIEPSVLGTLLNEYFTGVCSTIMDGKGTVIDFVGDAVFAIFGAPVPLPDHAALAIACANSIQQFSEEFRSSCLSSGVNWGVTRVGVHSGTALVGNFGSDLKFKYAPVGDVVNTASRLEGLNKYFGTHICLSHTAVAAAQVTGIRPLGRCLMKGKTEPIGVFEPMPAAWFNSAAGKDYLAAYQSMADGNREEALERFEQLVKQSPDDKCSLFHLNRLAEGASDDLVVMENK